VDDLFSTSEVLIQGMSSILKPEIPIKIQW